MPTTDRDGLSGPMKGLICLRVVAGAALLIAPGKVLGDLPADEVDGAVRAFARVLGARHLVEAAILLRDHTHRWVLFGAAVDGVHGATMLVLAYKRPDQRRVALANAVTASLLAGAGIEAGRHLPAHPVDRTDPAHRTVDGTNGGRP